MGANGQSLDPLLPTISQEAVFKWPDPIIPKPSMSESPDDMEYLKLDPIQDEDFTGVQRLLETLGYKFGIDTPPVYVQFNTRHNIK